MMLRRVFGASALGMAIMFAYLAAPVSVPAAVTAVESRKPAAGFALTDAKGSAVKLSDYKGRVVLLNFWATWCHGCGEEIPWFVEFQNKYKASGLTVVGVSMDDDGWKSVKPYLIQKKMNYPVVIGNQDLGKLYGLANMPMTLLIDRDGKIAATYAGVVDKDGCQKDIKTLLGGK